MQIVDRRGRLPSLRRESFTTGTTTRRETRVTHLILPPCLLIFRVFQFTVEIPSSDANVVKWRPLQSECFIWVGTETSGRGKTVALSA